MDCSKFRENVSPYLDSELTYQEQKALNSHKSVCPHCARLLEKMQSIRIRLKAGLTVSLSPGFVPDLQKRIRMEQNRKPVWWQQLLEPRAFGFSPVSLATISAAMIAVVLLIGGILTRDTAPLIEPIIPSIQAETPPGQAPAATPSAPDKSPAFTASSRDTAKTGASDTTRRDYSRQIKYVNQ